MTCSGDTYCSDCGRKEGAGCPKYEAVAPHPNAIWSPSQGWVPPDPTVDPHKKLADANELLRRQQEKPRSIMDMDLTDRIKEIRRQEGRAPVEDVIRPIEPAPGQKFWGYDMETAKRIDEPQWLQPVVERELEIIQRQLEEKHAEIARQLGQAPDPNA